MPHEISLAIETEKSEYVWVLNPDAEGELSKKLSYALPERFKLRILERKHLFDALTLGEPSTFAFSLLENRAIQHAKKALLWCPTPLALRQAELSGLERPLAPSVSILRKTHDKGFLTEALSELCIPGRAIIGSRVAWEEYRGSIPGDLRLKRAFGYAGKGQRIWPQKGSPDDSRWLKDSLRLGHFIAEPNLTHCQEVSLHGYVDGGGATIGSACRLITDRYGAPTLVSRMDTIESSIALKSLEPLGEQIAKELANSGYFGPFGVDFLVSRDQTYLIDLNPRFTLGWSVGMGEKRRTVLKRALSPEPYT